MTFVKAQEENELSKPKYEMAMLFVKAQEENE